MSTEQTPEVATEPTDSGSSNGDGRVDNREFRRSRHRECYCRGRNKNCPKCQGTGQLLPNWRENLNAARNTGRPADAGSAMSEAPSQAAPVAPVRENYPPRDMPSRDGPRDNGGYQQRDNGGYSNDRGPRNDRQQRWQDRRNGQGGGGRSNGRNNGPQQQNKGKTCPMCGEFVPNLRQHVLAKHDD